MSTLAQQEIDAHIQEDEFMAAALWWQLVFIATAMGKTFIERGGSSGSAPRKAANVSRDFLGAHMRCMVRYFWPGDEERPETIERGPSHPESAFKRRFWMPRTVFDKIFAGVVGTSAYVLKGLNPDATGKLGITPLIKVLTVLRMLAYGTSADFCGDVFDVSATTAQKCLDEFWTAMMDRFGSVYLQAPTVEEILRIEK